MGAIQEKLIYFYEEIINFDMFSNIRTRYFKIKRKYKRQNKKMN